MSFYKLQSVVDISDIYVQISPDVPLSLSNGVFGEKAEWYGFRCASEHTNCDIEPYIGFYTIGHLSNNIFLYNFGVDPKFQHNGYGTIMIKNIIEKYKDKTIVLFVKIVNKKAINLYRKHGFLYEDNMYKPPEGEICMARVWSI
jgi:ribosomal protein S18 acetylase RimI-like enzyme